MKIPLPHLQDELLEGEAAVTACPIERKPLGAQTRNLGESGPSLAGPYDIIPK